MRPTRLLAVVPAVAVLLSGGVVPPAAAEPKPVTERGPREGWTVDSH